VGITPATILAESAGIAVDSGITTDENGRTSDPHIWAAGDCASCQFNGQTIRLESVGNAIDQAEAVAKNIMKGDIPYQPKPWFWSDQYDCKLQIAGLNVGYTDVYVRKGDTPGTQSNWYYNGDQLLAVDAMNDARNYMIGKRLIEAGRSPDPAQITDPATDMKALLKP
jgi:3-phenylpropionate/trans-cinnamate dioxygenase ferredoxin reductase subunit